MTTDFIHSIRMAYTPPPFEAPVNGAPRNRQWEKQQDSLRKKAARCELWGQLQRVVNAQDRALLVNTKDENDGDTVLHKLVKGASFKHVKNVDDEVCKLLPDLLEMGADPFQVNNDGKIPQDYISTDTRWRLRRALKHELRTLGPVNRERLSRLQQRYQDEPSLRTAMLEKISMIRKGSLHRLVKFFKDLNNPMLPAIIEEALVFARIEDPELRSAQQGFLTPQQEVEFSLVDEHGAIRPRQGPKEDVPEDGNNCILRVVQTSSGPEIRGLVFPEKLPTESGIRKLTHNHSYSAAHGGHWFAGEIAFTDSGKICHLSNKSGHNQPSTFTLAAALVYLFEQGLVDVDVLELQIWQKGMTEFEGSDALRWAYNQLRQRHHEVRDQEIERLVKTYAHLEETSNTPSLSDKVSQPREPNEERAWQRETQRARMIAYEKWQEACADARLLRNIGYNPKTERVNRGRGLPLTAYTAADVV